MLMQITFDYVKRYDFIYVSMCFPRRHALRIEIRSACHLEQPSSHLFSPGLRPLPSYLLCTNLQPLKSGLSEGFKPQGLGCLDHLIIGYCGFFEYNNRLGNNVQRNNDPSAHLSISMSRIARLIQQS
jgi:hypothetical protein